MNHFSDFEYQKKRFFENLDKIKPNDQEYIKKAYSLAEKQHVGQSRHSKNPYFIHCLRITNNAIEKMHILDKDVLAAALLHDTAEDTDLTIEEIREEFSDKTAEMVDKLTRDTRGEKESNKYEKKFLKHQKTLEKDINTRTIKALDHLDNATSWSNLPKGFTKKKKIKRWIKEIENIHIPMASTVDTKIAKEIEEKLEIVKTLKIKKT